METNFLSQRKYIYIYILFKKFMRETRSYLHNIRGKSIFRFLFVSDNQQNHHHHPQFIYVNIFSVGLETWQRESLATPIFISWPFNQIQSFGATSCYCSFSCKLIKPNAKIKVRKRSRKKTFTLKSKLGDGTRITWLLLRLLFIELIRNRQRICYTSCRERTGPFSSLICWD